MSENANGKNEIKIYIPNCNNEEMEFIYRSPDNKLPYSIFQTLLSRVGLTATVKEETDGEITVMKGTG